jgi:cytochrome c biogenesis protein CcmG/thiol:disulfide interchange protein DsbE
MKKMSTLSTMLMAAVLVWSSNGRADQVVVGGPAPDFQAKTFDGRKISLADYRGRVLVINFWATWCGPCRRELPLLNAYYRSQKAAGLEVIAAATEDSVPNSQLRPLAEKVAIPFLLKMRGPYAALKAVPTNIVIDRNGIVRYARAGAFTLDGLNELLVPLLRERADTSLSPVPTS